MSDELKDMLENILFYISDLIKEKKHLEDLYNQLLKDYDELIQENERFKEALEVKQYCKYANKCNEMYDCSKEEYHTMAESNMKLSLRIDEAVEYIKQQTTDEDTGKDLGYSDNIDYEYLLNILEGKSDE